MTSSTELPLDDALCPHCKTVLLADENASEWCPRCGARLRMSSVPTVSVGLPRWKVAAMTATSGVILVFGILGPCALVGYGGWRFSQTPFGALALKSLIVFLVVAHAIGIVKWLLRKS